MAQSEARSRPQERPSPPVAPFGELSVVGGKRVEEYVIGQAELVKALEGINRRWVDRLQSEANLASDLAAKLVAARSVPDALAAWQEWTQHRLELMAEDCKNVLADTQKLMESGGRFVSPGGMRIPGGN